MKKILILLLLLSFTTNIYAQDPTKEPIDPTKMTIKEFFELNQLFKIEQDTDKKTFLLLNIVFATGTCLGMKRTFSIFITTTKKELDCINKIDFEEIERDYKHGMFSANESLANVCSFKMLDCLNEKNKKRVSDNLNKR